VNRRSGEGRGKPLDEGSTGPIVVENFGGGLYPAVDVSDDDDDDDNTNIPRYAIHLVETQPEDVL
jgi:hypothetical protein